MKMPIEGAHSPVKVPIGQWPQVQSNHEEVQHVQGGHAISRSPPARSK